VELIIREIEALSTNQETKARGELRELLEG
jgi:hypothetical protein